MRILISKRDKISPTGLFFILFISRVVVCLTNVQSLTFSTLSSDILISFVLAFAFTLLLCIPAVFCIKKHKNPFDVQWIGALYFLYFIFVGAVNISRFSYFASTTLNPDEKAWMFALFITVCAFYGACLGIEALSRFSFFAFVLIMLAIFVVVLSNIRQYEEINLYPIITDSNTMILRNALNMSSNSAEIAVFLCLADKINKTPVKSFGASVSASYLTVFIILLFVFAVLGDGASSNSFPVYTLFQVTKITAFERLDIIHISFWIMAVFIKAVLFIYCACVSIKKFKNIHKCIIAAAATFGVSLVFISTGMGGNVSPEVLLIPFILFCAAIPLAVLIFKNKNKGDDIVKKF